MRDTCFGPGNKTPTNAMQIYDVGYSKEMISQGHVYVLSGHSERVGSSHVCPAAFRGTALFFVSAFCSPSPLAKAALTLSRASGVMVCASL